MIAAKKNNLVIAIQKAGRLSEESLELLVKCDIAFEKSKRKLLAVAKNFPLEILFLRDDDIPGCIERGEADIAIVGENVIRESLAATRLLQKLAFGDCKLSIAVPKTTSYESIQSLEGVRIATSYPNILKRFLAESGVRAEIRYLSGSVEIAPSIGIADAIFDIVSTGSTLLAHGLAEVEVVLRSQAALVGNLALSTEKLIILDRLLLRVRAVITGAENKYILLNAPDEAIGEICRLLPGITSPTILPLRRRGWSSVHSVVPVDQFWELIETLKISGAEGILVSSVEKVIV